jgi:hypothetical protein
LDDAKNVHNSKDSPVKSVCYDFFITAKFKLQNLKENYCRHFSDRFEDSIEIRQTEPRPLATLLLRSSSQMYQDTSIVNTCTTVLN